MLTPSKRALTRVTAPASEPITLEEAKLYLRVDEDIEDDLITGLIAVARQMAEEYMRTSLITQQWKLSFNDYAPDEVALSRGPVQEIVSVTSYERNEEGTLIDNDVYVLSAAKDTLLFDATIYGHRVEIIYDAGYGEAEDVPTPIKYGMLAHIASMYERRGDAVTALPRESIALYAPFREVSL